MKRPSMRSGVARALRTVRGWPLLVLRGRLRRVGLVLSGAVLIACGTHVGIGWATALPEGTVFRAGDTMLNEQDFDERLGVLKALYGVTPPKQGPRRDGFNRDAAKSVAVSVVLDRAAREHDVAVGEKKARDALHKITKEQLPGGREAFVQFLGNEGIAEHDVLEEIKRQLSTSELFEKITREVRPVGGPEVRQAYQDRKKEMVRPETRQLRNIVVRSEDAAGKIAEQARSGVDFAALAKQHTMDRTTKPKGGDLGKVQAEQLDDTYADAAFRAEKGAIFGPVKTKHGWNVGQVGEIIPAKDLSFQEVRKQLEANLNNKRKLDTWRTWLGNQIKAANIEYADQYRPENPDAAPADVPPQ